MQLFIEFFHSSGSTIVGSVRILNHMKEKTEKLLSMLNNGDEKALSIIENIEDGTRVNLLPLGVDFSNLSIVTPLGLANTIMVCRDYSQYHYIMPITYKTTNKVVYGITVQSPTTS